jgi:hypothetical protein
LAADSRTSGAAKVARQELDGEFDRRLLLGRRDAHQAVTCVLYRVTEQAEKNVA